jgi:hypothetical protein
MAKKPGESYRQFKKTGTFKKEAKPLPKNATGTFVVKRGQLVKQPKGKR